MNLKELSGKLQEAGVVGAGGAGFPTYAKLSPKIETLILNCAECEPLLRLHRQLLKQYADEIVRAFSLIGEAVEAKELIIGIKKEYHETIDALQQCIGAFPKVCLGLLDEVYPAGDEVVLIYEVTKKVVRPGGLPIEAGVAVLNVETVYNVHRCLHENTPNQDKLVSVVGEVTNPVTVRVPLGATIQETVARAGIITTPGPVFFIGGPMMGNVGSGAQPVTRTTNAILVLPENHIIIQKKRSNPSIDLKRAAASCCQCTMCTDLCPRHQLGHPVTPHAFMQAASLKDIQQPDIFLDTMFCSSCGLCEMYSCMQSLSPRTLMAEYKGGLRGHGIKPPAVEAKPVAEAREYRKVPMKRLMSRLNLTQYNEEAPLQDNPIEVSQVKILLSQHIGAPAVSVVEQGDSVTVGQQIAKAGSGLSVAIHASIDGKVVEVTDKYVIIKRQER